MAYLAIDQHKYTSILMFPPIGAHLSALGRAGSDEWLFLPHAFRWFLSFADLLKELLTSSFAESFGWQKSPQQRPPIGLSASHAMSGRFCLLEECEAPGVPAVAPSVPAVAASVAAGGPAESVFGATDSLVWDQGNLRGAAALSSAALKDPCFAFCPGLGLCLLLAARIFCWGLESWSEAYPPPFEARPHRLSFVVCSARRLLKSYISHCLRMYSPSVHCGQGKSRACRCEASTGRRPCGTLWS